MLTIGVASVEDALNRIEAAGGTVVQPRTEVPGMGAFGYFTDTEGNTLGLWETGWTRGISGGGERPGRTASP